MKNRTLEERLREAGVAGPAAEQVAASVRHARLRRRDADEVARELEAHFEDGLASGRPLAQLIGDFGDPAVAGPLIGRGVRRRRHAGRAAFRLAEVFSLLVLAAYLVSFARLRTGSPESPAGRGQGDPRREALASWSASGPSIETALARGRALVDGARSAATSGGGSRSTVLLLGAIETAREIRRGPTPAHDLAALRLAGEAVSSTAALLAAGAFSFHDRARIVACLDGLPPGSFDWDASKLREAFGRLLSAMYTPGEDGRLTTEGLRIFQAWKGKTRSSLAAVLLEPVYFPEPARRSESLRELDRFLALAAAGQRDPAFERERSLLQSSAWRRLRFVSLAIPLDHMAAAREASRDLERAILDARASVAGASRRS